MDDLSSGEPSPESPGPVAETPEEPAPPIVDDIPVGGEEVAAPRPLAQVPLKRRFPPALRRPHMSRRRWAGVATSVALVVALVAVGSRFVGSGATASTGLSPSLAPGASPIAATSGPQATDESSARAVQSGPATASAGQSIGPVVVPTQTAPTATITFQNIVVDSAIDPARTLRTFTFESDGPGAISAQVVASSPIDTTTLCLAMDDATATCVTGGTPSFPAVVTETHHSRWIATLISAGESSPTVDVAFSWPTNSPSITLGHGRFQGAPNRDSLRTLTVVFKPRAGGNATLDASWPPGVLDASVVLTDITKAPEAKVRQIEYAGETATSPVYSAPVSAARTYRLTLLNDGADGLRPDLTATITFP